MEEEVLDLFKEHLEKQEVLSRLTEAEVLHGLGYSEIHCISAIGHMENPNVTKIAGRMKLTRGAVSKITKKLMSNGSIVCYSLPGNKKEIYFRLTDDGKELFVEHEKRHEIWKQRDREFFNKYSREQLEAVRAFMADFNQYLEEKIKDLGGKEDV